MHRASVLGRLVAVAVTIVVLASSDLVARTLAENTYVEGWATKLAVYEATACLLAANSGRVSCWTNSPDGAGPYDVGFPDAMAPFDDVAVGDGFVCAVVHATKRVVCSGRIGNTYVSSQDVVDLSTAGIPRDDAQQNRVKRVFATKATVCVQMEADDDAYVCWGDNTQGNIPWLPPDDWSLTNSPYTYMLPPVRTVMPTECPGPVVLFALGDKTSIIGTNERDCDFIVGKAPQFPLRSLGAGRTFCPLGECPMWGTLGLQSTNTSYDWGYSHVAFRDGWNVYAVLASNRTVYVYGNNPHGELGLGLPISTNQWTGSSWDGATPVPVTMQETEQFGLGDSFWCFLHRTNRTVLCTGRNDHGQLGQGDVADRNVPTLVDLGRNCVRVADLLVQTYHVCVRCADSGLVKCWGYGADGRLGPWNSGNGDWGVAPNQMGDALPAVNSIPPPTFPPATGMPAVPSRSPSSRSPSHPPVVAASDSNGASATMTGVAVGGAVGGLVLLVVAAGVVVRQMGHTRRSVRQDTTTTTTTTGAIPMAVPVAEAVAYSSNPKFRSDYGDVDSSPSV